MNAPQRPPVPLDDAHPLCPLPGGLHDLHPPLKGWIMQHITFIQPHPRSFEPADATKWTMDEKGIVLAGECVDQMAEVFGEDAAVFQYVVDLKLYHARCVPIMAQERFLIYGRTRAALLYLSLFHE